MDMPVFVSIVLIISGVWSLVVWPQFLKRVTKDPRARDATGTATKFLRVHQILVGISLVLGVATAAVGVTGLLS